MASRLAEVLDSIGLAPAEKDIFLTLFNNPSSTASSIAKLSGLRASVVYYNLDRLSRKGFVSFIEKNNKRRYSAIEGSALRDILLKKQRYLGDILAWVGDLKQPSTSHSASHVSFFEGWKGVAQAFLIAIDRAPEKCQASSFVIGRLSGMEDYQKQGLLRKIVDLRKQKRITTEVIITKSAKKTVGRWHLEQGASKIKFIDDCFESPSVMNIYGDYVVIGVYQGVVAAILIHSPHVAKAFRSYFHALWGLSKPI